MRHFFVIKAFLIISDLKRVKTALKTVGFDCVFKSEEKLVGFVFFAKNSLDDNERGVPKKWYFNQVFGKYPELGIRGYCLFL